MFTTTNSPTISVNPPLQPYWRECSRQQTVRGLRDFSSIRRQHPTCGFWLEVLWKRDFSTFFWLGNPLCGFSREFCIAVLEKYSKSTAYCTRKAWASIQAGLCHTHRHNRQTWNKCRFLIKTDLFFVFERCKGFLLKSVIMVVFGKSSMKYWRRH